MEFKINDKSTLNEIDKVAKGGEIIYPGNSKEFKTGSWRVKKPIWIEEKCKQCSLCWPVCPDDCIVIDKENKKRKDFNYDYCKGCGICAEVCPFKAIEMKDIGE